METPPTTRRFIAYMAGILLVMLLVVYPLSIGPATFYLERHKTAQNKARINAFYRPVLRLFWAIPPLQRPMSAYVGFWGRLARNGAPYQTPPTPTAEP